MPTQYQRVSLGENITETIVNGDLVLPEIQISADGKTLHISIPIKTIVTDGTTDNTVELHSERDLVPGTDVYSDAMSVMIFGTAERASRLVVSANLKSKVPDSGGI
ncbi:MAG: hypothetical protein JWQ30_1305 [Sediminibacterium sp.]|nr:hypothetical protein [Sediminibacterium sp.]